MDQRTITTAFGKQVVNPVVKAAVEHGLAPASYAVLETTGRRSGVPRLTSVGNGPNGDTFWIVAEHRRRAAYVHTSKLPRECASKSATVGMKASDE